MKRLSRSFAKKNAPGTQSNNDSINWPGRKDWQKDSFRACGVNVSAENDFIRKE
jgi:hypothetical protein